MTLRMVHVATFLALLLCQPVYPGPLDETLYCGPPERLADGTIKRRADVIKAFKRIHPCPVTGLATGPCAGWQVDHVLPLSVCGCDSVSNMTWLPVAIKTCASSTGFPCKDQWERKVYKCPGEPIELIPASQPIPIFFY